MATMKITPGNNELEIVAPAKVNLFLELKGKRDDGFHEIETVMSSIAVYDHLRFQLRNDSLIKLNLSYSSPGLQPREKDVIPSDQRNLICKSVALVREIATAEGKAAHCEQGMNIELLKNIPSAAGLGGASGNSAAAIIAANRLWKLAWPKQKLEEIAGQLGSDIGFFMSCGTAVCTGRGEIVEPLLAPARLALVVAKPEESLSTADVFSKVKLKPESIPMHHSASLIQSVRGGCLREIGGHFFNRLQQFASQVTEQIATLREEFNRLGCLGHQMTGSGSCYFGLFPNSRAAKIAANRLSSRVRNTRIFCTHTTSANPSFLFSAERRRLSWKSQK